MYAILTLTLDGFYVRGEGGDASCVVFHEGAVLDCGALARQRGVVPGTPLREAKTILREGARYVAYREENYTGHAAAWLDLCALFSDRVERGMPHVASIDLTGHPSPQRAADELLGALAGSGVFESVSAGLAPAKWVAQLCSQPVDLEIVRLGVPWCSAVTDVARLLADVPTRLLAPVSPEHRSRLEFLGYRWSRDVAATPLSVLRSQFGDAASQIHEAALGRILDAVKPNYPPGSVSETQRFAAPLNDRLELESAVHALCRQLAARLCESDQTARQIELLIATEASVPVRLGRRLGKPTQAAHPLAVVCLSLLSKADLADPPVALTVRLSDIVAAPRGQRSLTGFNGADEKARACESALRAVNASFGDDTLIRAKDLRVARRVDVLRAWKNATGWR